VLFTELKKAATGRLQTADNVRRNVISVMLGLCPEHLRTSAMKKTANISIT
jgi:hypothetical protein